MKQKICIIGDGLTGLTAALILSDLNITIHLIAPNLNNKLKDNRTTAISSSNYDFLLKFLEKKSSKLFWPSTQIDLYHELSAGYKHFMNFQNNGKNLMYIFENSKLKKLLIKKIKNNKKIKIFRKEINQIDINNSAVLFQKKNFFYDSIFLCVGKKSKIVKNLTGRRSVYENMKDIAFTTIVKHNSKIINTRQYFLKEGPLAILPISKKQFSLVWSINKNYNLENTDSLIRKKLKIILNSDKKVSFSKVNFFPISFKFNINCLKKNVLVLGEGSYNIHPIAGQGYNLISRDIKTLYTEIGKYLSNGMQLKDSQVLNNFVNIRKPENFLFVLGINFLNRFFRHNKITQPIKNIILRDINKFKFLKDLSLNLSNKGIFY